MYDQKLTETLICCDLAKLSTGGARSSFCDGSGDSRGAATPARSGSFAGRSAPALVTRKHDHAARCDGSQAISKPVSLCKREKGILHAYQNVGPGASYSRRSSQLGLELTQGEPLRQRELMNIDHGRKIQAGEINSLHVLLDALPCPACVPMPDPGEPHPLYV